MRTTKASSKGFNWKLIFLLVGVGGIVFFMTGSNGDSSTTKANTTSPKSASATTDGYLKEDHDARFASLKIEPRDAFEPLISKATTAKIDPFTISDKLTGGGDWMYTGMVQVNGQSEALLEEQKTGESDYVALGQHWKKARIKRISDSDLELVGDDGETAVVKMGEETSSTKPDATTSPATTPPAPLQGNINANQLDVTPLPNAQPNQPNLNRRGRGRRNRMNTADNGDQNGS